MSISQTFLAKKRKKKKDAVQKTSIFLDINKLTNTIVHLDYK